MDVTEFALQIGIDTDQATDAFALFEEELNTPRKTLAARAADLAAGLRRLDIDEAAVHVAVCALAAERRR